MKNKKVSEFIFPMEISDPKDNNNSSIIVYGNPLHCNTEKLIHEYKIKEINKFLQWQLRYSFGNYVMIDLKNEPSKIIIIITSPGFCGGYKYQSKNGIILATVLSDLLEKSKETIEINEAVLERSLNVDPTHNLPTQTVFMGVERLLPAMILEISGNEVISEKSYLTMDVEAPLSFTEALEETIQCLLKNYDPEQITLMYSGGIDSSTLFAGLDKFSNGKFKLLSFDYRNFTNHPLRAKRIADEMGYKVEEADFIKISESDEYCEKLEQLLEKDIINPYNPSWAVPSRSGNKEEIVISGQNFDSLAILDMRRQQLSRTLYLLKTGNIISAGLDILWNIQFSDFFLNENFRKIYLSLIPAKYGEEKGRADFLSFLQGFISTGKPGRIKTSDRDLTEKAIDSFYKIVSTNNQSLLTDILYYYYYQFNCSHLITKFTLNTNVELILPALNGPIRSYFFNQKRNLFTILSPKEELIRSFNDITGRNFYKLINGRELKNRRTSSLKKRNSRLLERNIFLLDSGDSKLLDKIKNKALRERFRESNRKILGKIKINEGLTKREIEQGVLFVNFEKILRNVEGE